MSAKKRKIVHNHSRNWKVFLLGERSKGGQFAWGWRVLWLTARHKALLAKIRQRRERLLPQAWCRFWQSSPAFPPETSLSNFILRSIHICTQTHRQAHNPETLLKLTPGSATKWKLEHKANELFWQHSQDWKSCPTLARLIQYLA